MIFSHAARVRKELTNLRIPQEPSSASRQLSRIEQSILLAQGFLESKGVHSSGRNPCEVRYVSYSPFNPCLAPWPKEAAADLAMAPPEMGLQIQSGRFRIQRKLRSKQASNQALGIVTGASCFVNPSKLDKSIGVPSDPLPDFSWFDFIGLSVKCQVCSRAGYARPPASLAAYFDIAVSLERRAGPASQYPTIHSPSLGKHRLFLPDIAPHDSPLDLR